MSFGLTKNVTSKNFLANKINIEKNNVKIFLGLSVIGSGLETKFKSL
jgi:hypothetical protein